MLKHFISHQLFHLFSSQRFPLPPTCPYQKYGSNLTERCWLHVIGLTIFLLFTKLRLHFCP